VLSFFEELNFELWTLNYFAYWHFLQQRFYSFTLSPKRCFVGVSSRIFRAIEKSFFSRLRLSGTGRWKFHALHQGLQKPVLWKAKAFPISIRLSKENKFLSKNFRLSIF